MRKTDIASAVEWIGTVGAAGWWSLAGVRHYFPNQGTWLIATSNANLMIGFAILAVVLIARYSRTGHLFRRTPFDLLMLIFLMGAIVGLLASYNPERDALRFCLLVSAIAFFYLLADSTPGAARRFATSLILLAVILTVHFLLQHDFENHPVKLDISNRIGLFFSANMPDLGLTRIQGNPNLTASIMALVMPFNLALLASLWKRQKRAASLLILLLSLFLAFGIFVSASRGSMGALLGALALWSVRRAVGRLKNPKVGAAIFILAVVIGLGCFGVVVARSDLLGTVSGGLGRSKLYRDGAYLVRDYLFTGAGLGTYPMVYSTYSLFSHVGFVSHAHNLYLQVWLEQGMLGGLALLGMVLLVLLAILRGDESGGSELWTVRAARWSSVVMLLHGLVDAPLYPDDQSMMLFLTFGLMVAGLPVTPRSRISKRARWNVLVPLVLLLVAATVWYRPLLSTAYANLGALEQTRKELSVYVWPEWGIQDEVRVQVDLTDAERWYRQALELDPGNVTANRRMGMIALARGEYARALEYLETAFVAAPGDNATRQLVGEAYIANGQAEKGAALWADVNNAQRQLVLREYWYDQIGDSERVEWIRQAASAR